MPGKGQPLDMGEQPITHSLHQALRPPCVKKHEQIAESHRKQRHNHQQATDQPEPVTKIAHAANRSYPVHQKFRQFQLVITQNTVNRGSYQLRREHIQPRYAQRRKNTDYKILNAPPQEIQNQRDSCIRLPNCFRFINAHDRLTSFYGNSRMFTIL